MKGKIKLSVLAVLLALGMAVSPFLSLRLHNSYAQNNTPVQPLPGPVNFPYGILDGCDGTATLANGVKEVTDGAFGAYTNGKCSVMAVGVSALAYAGIGIECAATTTATATATATSTATTAAYGGTTIATATATSTATSTAITGLTLTASTLSASPVVAYHCVN